MDFSNLNKKASDSFHKQRNMLKQLAQGKTLKCEKCNTVLTLDLATCEVGKRRGEVQARLHRHYFRSWRLILIKAPLLKSVTLTTRPTLHRYTNHY